jgi:hypothetical protein
MIEIFVRSFSQYMDVDTYREMSTHPYCAPGTNEGLVGQAVSKFKGRLLSPEDSNVVQHVLEIIGKTGELIKMYDVSKVADRLKAVRHGIRKTPVALIDGRKYEGLDEILKALSTMGQTQQPSS